MWIPTLLDGKELTWTNVQGKPNGKHASTFAKEAIRAAQLNCPEMDLLPVQQRVSIVELPFPCDHVLVRLADEQDQRALYGYLHTVPGKDEAIHAGDHLHPLASGMTLEMIRFHLGLVPEKGNDQEDERTKNGHAPDVDRKDAEQLEGALPNAVPHEQQDPRVRLLEHWASTFAEHLTAGQAELAHVPRERVRVYLPGVRWKALDGSEELGRLVRQALSTQLEHADQAELWWSETSVYKEHDLLEIIERVDHRYERTYALFRRLERQVVITPVRRGLLLNAFPDLRPGGLNINSQNVLDFARLYFFVHHFDKGRLHCVGSATEVPLKQLTAEQASEIAALTFSPRMRSAPVTDQVAEVREADAHFSLVGAFNGTLYEVDCAVSFATGAVHMYGAKDLVPVEVLAEEIVTADDAADDDLAFISHTSLQHTDEQKEDDKDPIWAGPVRPDRDSTWTTPDTTLARRLLRAAILNCPRSKIRLSEGSVRIQRLDYRFAAKGADEPAPYLKEEYVLVRLADRSSSRELYGLVYFRDPQVALDHFHPLIGHAAQRTLFQHLLDVERNEAAQSALDDLWASFEIHRSLHAHRLAQPLIHDRVWIPALDWRPLTEAKRSKHTQLALEPYFSAPDRLLLWVAPLPFYKHYHLLEVLEHGRTGWRRYYALIKWGADKATLRVVHGGYDIYSIPVEEEGELHSLERYALDYVHFYFFIRHATTGMYTPYHDRHDLCTLTIGAAAQKGLEEPLERRLSLEEIDNKALANYGGTKSYYQVNMIFDRSLYTTRIAMDPSTGRMDLFDDRLLAENAVISPDVAFDGARARFLKLNYRKLNRIVHARQIAFHDRNKQDQPGRISTIDPAEFRRRLERDGAVHGLTVQGDVVLELWRNAFHTGAPLDHISVFGCTFEGHVNLYDRHHGPQLEFVDCTFLNGVSAKDSALCSSLNFIGCTFESDRRNVLPDRPMLPALDLENLHINGDLVLHDCTVVGRLFAPGMELKGSLSLFGCTVALAELPAKVPFKWIDEIARPYNGGQTFHFAGVECPLRTDINLLVLDGCIIGGMLKLTFAGHALQPQTQASEFLRRPTDLDHLQATLVVGNITAQGLRVSGSVECYGLVCAGNMDLSTSTLEGNVSLGGLVSAVKGFERIRSQCRVMGQLVMRYCNVRGTLDMANLEVSSSMDLFGIRIRGWVRLMELHVGDSLDMREANVGGTIFAERAITLQSDREILDIGGYLLMDGAETAEIKLEAPRIRKGFQIKGGTFASIKLVRAPVRNDEGIWDMCPARIGGLLIYQARIGSALQFPGIEVVAPKDPNEGPAHPNDPEKVAIWIRNTEIGGDLVFFDHVEGPDPALTKVEEDKALGNEQRTRVLHDRWTRSRIDQNDYGCRIVGHMDLQGTRIAGKLDLKAVHLTGKSSILAHDLHVRRDIDISASSIGDKVVYGLHTTCHHVDLEKLECSGDLLFDGLTARGSLKAVGAHVKGAIALGEMHGQDWEEKLRLRQHQAEKARSSDEPVLASSGDPCASIHGLLDLTAAHAGHLKLPQNCVQDKDRKAFTLKGQEVARISLQRGEINKLEIEAPTASIDLSGVKVARWEFAKDAKPLDTPERRKALKRRWITESLHRPERRRNVDVAELFVDILEPMQPFDQSTWVEVEKSLRNEAMDRDADEIYRTMRRMERKRLTGRRRLFSWLSDITTRYGTALLLPMWVYVPIFMLTVLIMRDPRNVDLEFGKAKLLHMQDGRFSTTDPFAPPLAAGAALPNGSHVLELSRADVFVQDPWTTGDAIIMALRYCIPLVPLDFHGAWTAGQRPLVRLGPCSITAEGYSVFAMIMSTICLSIMLLGVTSRMVRGKGGG